LNPIRGDGQIPVASDKPIVFAGTSRLGHLGKGEEKRKEEKETYK
jgi:hypothetical protein